MTTKVTCPQCGGINTQFVRAKDGFVDIMCWGSCGMDFRVNGIWFMLNSWKEEFDQDEMSDEVEEENRCEDDVE